MPTKPIKEIFDEFIDFLNQSFINTGIVFSISQQHGDNHIILVHKNGIKKSILLRPIFKNKTYPVLIAKSQENELHSLFERYSSEKSLKTGLVELFSDETIQNLINLILKN